MVDFSSALTEKLGQIQPRSVSIEIATLAGCILVAWGVCRWFGRDQPRDSIWFGKRVFDGLLFPVLALLLTDLARRATQDFQPAEVLLIAVSVFVSLVVIRLFARVFS